VAAGNQARTPCSIHGQIRDHGIGPADSLRGNVVVDAVVAQGCRPVGQPLTVTRHEQNVLVEVNHQPPLRYLGELVESMSDYDRQLMRTALFLGLQVDEPEQECTGHDFLIRNLVGIDYQRGSSGRVGPRLAWASGCSSICATR
jgi:small ligand-binding sensory domain FIST